MLFATSGQTEAGRGEYTSTTACTGALTNAWDVIAIGTATTAAADTQVVLGNETGSGTNNAAGMPGLERGTATTKTWTNVQVRSEARYYQDLRNDQNDVFQILPQKK